MSHLILCWQWNLQHQQQQLWGGQGLGPVPEANKRSVEQCALLVWRMYLKLQLECRINLLMCGHCQLLSSRNPPGGNLHNSKITGQIDNVPEVACMAGAPFCSEAAQAQPPHHLLVMGVAATGDALDTLIEWLLALGA